MTIKDNKILSHFRKTNSIVNSLVPSNGAKNLIDYRKSTGSRSIDKDIIS